MLIVGNKLLHNFVCVCVLMCHIIKCFLPGYGQMSYLPSMSMDLSKHDFEQNSSKSSEFQENYDVSCEIFLGTFEETIFSQHQESCIEDSFNPLQPLRLDCSLNWKT